MLLLSIRSINSYGPFQLASSLFVLEFFLHQTKSSDLYMGCTRTISACNLFSRFQFSNSFWICDVGWLSYSGRYIGIYPESEHEGRYRGGSVFHVVNSEVYKLQVVILSVAVLSHRCFSQIFQRIMHALRIYICLWMESSGFNV